MLPNNQIDSPMYVAVWVADDPADGTGGVADGNPSSDVNGTLTLHAEAIGPSRHAQGHRGDRGADVEHRNRARPDRPARSGRAEPARPQGGRADARQDADEHADEQLDWQSGRAVMTEQTDVPQDSPARAPRAPPAFSRHVAPPRRRDGAACRPRDASGGRRPPSRSSIRCCSSSACRRRSSSCSTRRCACSRTAAATSTIPNFYVVSDDAAVMPAFSNINARDDEDLPPCLQQPAVGRVAGQVHGRQHHRDRGGVGSGERADVEQRRRSGSSWARPATTSRSTGSPPR